MSETAKNLFEMELLSKEIQLRLHKGSVTWEDESVQFFIPVALSLTNFEWLELIAEHNLVEEDEKVVKNFLSMVQSLVDVNSNGLHDAIKDNIKGMM